MSLPGTRAVITGASSGIGRATALAFARAGLDLVIAARREKELEDVATRCRDLGVRAFAVQTDVSDRAECVRLIERATELLGGVDILVANAGFAFYDRIDSARIEDLKGMMDTNYFGAVHAIQAVLPQMLERKRGAIVITSSITGIMGFAGMGGYCATKFALNGFAEALRDEVIDRGIAVSLVCPGTTDTEYFLKADRGKQPRASRLILAIPPERVAAEILKSARSGKDRRVIPILAAIYMKFKELTPRAAHYLMRRVSSSLERSRR